MAIRTYVLRNQTLRGANPSGLAISVLPLNQVRQSILAVRTGNALKINKKNPSIATRVCKLTMDTFIRILQEH